MGAEAEQRGAGEILLTSMDRDGTRDGFDCELTASGRRSGQHSGDCFRRRGSGGALRRSLSRRQRRCGAGGVHLSSGHNSDRRAQTGLAGRRNSREVAMLIPSIDLMGGKIVQLVQGEKKALEFDDFEPWVERFCEVSAGPTDRSRCGDGTGRQPRLVRSLVRRLPCQVGGGIRTAETAQEILADGLCGSIIGSSLIKDGSIQHCIRRRTGRAGGRRQTGLRRGFKRRKSRDPGMAADHRNFRCRK